MDSKFSPPGIVHLGLAFFKSIFLELVLWDRPDNFVTLLPAFKIKWQQNHANKEVGIFIQVREIPRVSFTLEGMQHEIEFRMINLDKIFLGPVSLKRLRFAPREISLEQSAVVLSFK